MVTAQCAVHPLGSLAPLQGRESLQACAPLLVTLLLFLPDSFHGWLLQIYVFCLLSYRQLHNSPTSIKPSFCVLVSLGSYDKILRVSDLYTTEIYFVTVMEAVIPCLACPVFDRWLLLSMMYSCGRRGHWAPLGFFKKGTKWWLVKALALWSNQLPSPHLFMLSLWDSTLGTRCEIWGAGAYVQTVVPQ